MQAPVPVTSAQAPVLAPLWAVVQVTTTPAMGPVQAVVVQVIVVRTVALASNPTQTPAAAHVLTR